MFEPEEYQALHKIALVGVGNCGGNAIDYIKAVLADNIDYYFLDTASKGFNGENEIPIGQTNGLSAGAIPDVGKLAMESSLNDVLPKLTDYDLIFLVGGLGGGTATGALPVLAEGLAKMNAVTIYVVTTPFAFEGRKKEGFASFALKQILEHADCVIPVSNEKMLQSLPKNISLREAFDIANDVLKNSILGIYSMISNTGNINLDFADLRTTLECSGYAMIGQGEGAKQYGDKRIEMAIKNALQNPLLEEFDLSTSQRALVNIQANEDLGLFEMHQAGEAIQQHISLDIPAIWGVEIVESIEELSVFVILTGVKPKAELEKERAAQKDSTLSFLTIQKR